MIRVPDPHKGFGTIESRIVPFQAQNSRGISPTQARCWSYISTRHWWLERTSRTSSGVSAGHKLLLGGL